MIILGIDPGTTTGFASLPIVEGVGGPRYGQPVLGQLKGTTGTLYALDLMLRACDGVAIEAFVIGRGSQRAGAAGAWTREVISFVWPTDRPVCSRSAATVKPWATDKRLAALGADITGLPHAGDALRHALYSAVRDHGWPDPLTLEWTL